MLCNDYLAGVDTQNHEYISDHIRSKCVPGDHRISHFINTTRPGT
jgi:hypothetical protein